VHEPLAGMSAVVVVQFFCIVFFISWVLAVRTPPGSPDESWRGSRADCQEQLDTCREYRHRLFPKIKEEMCKICEEENPKASEQLAGWLKAHPNQVIEVMQSIKNRWCTHCGAWKPDRTHHSRRLGQCVLRMDHVCPWINNVVGLRNYKYFFLMLFYAIVLLFAYVVAATLLLVHIAQLKQKYMVKLPFLAVPVGGSWDFWVTQAVLIVTSVGLIGPLGYYWLFQCHLIASGLTSIEKKERTHSDARMASSVIVDRELFVPSPWDLGFFANVSSHLGNCFLLWPIPTTIGLGLNKPGAGTVYKIRKGHPMRKQNWDIESFLFPKKSN